MILLGSGLLATVAVVRKLYRDKILNPSSFTLTRPKAGKSDFFVQILVRVSSSGSRCDAAISAK